MYKYRSGRALVIIVLITALLVVAGGGMWLLLKGFQKSEEVAAPILESRVRPQETETLDRAPFSQVALQKYTNVAYGFTLSYPTTIRPFEETFAVDTAEHYYSCRWYDKAHETYENEFYFSKIPFGPESDVEAQCSRVNLSFEEYMEKYFESFKASTARNAKLWKIPNTSDLKAYGLFWEIPLHGATPDSPQIGWAAVYSVLVEIPKERNSEKRALHLSLSGNVSSCPNALCEGSETPLSCPADCKEGWDAILNKILASFEFTQ